MKILVTGGSGFIGSNFVRMVLEKGHRVTNLDKITYAAKGKNLQHMGIYEGENYRFVHGDTCNSELVDMIFKEEQPDIVFDIAAESHVDRSIEDPLAFIKTDTLGAATIFTMALKHKTQKIVHISTDEVYGSIQEGSFKEDSLLNPTSPYSSSKAAADLIGLAYFKTYGLPIVITRSANNYGPYQFPNKCFLPFFITNALQREKVPLFYSGENPGLNRRDYLNVKDNCEAIWTVGMKGKEGEIYNIPGMNERVSIDITKFILGELGYGDEMIQYTPHRKAHDPRYSIDGGKLSELGFKHQYTKDDFYPELSKLIQWHKDNKSWWEPLKGK
jgi:dTDP-glucose 4,6-dehydratase